MSPVGTIFVPFSPTTGTNLLHPRRNESDVKKLKVFDQESNTVEDADNTVILAVVCYLATGIYWGYARFYGRCYRPTREFESLTLCFL